MNDFFHVLFYSPVISIVRSKFLLEAGLMYTGLKMTPKWAGWELKEAEVMLFT